MIEVLPSFHHSFNYQNLTRFFNRLFLIEPYDHNCSMTDQQVSGLEFLKARQAASQSNHKSYYLIQVKDNGIGFEQTYAEQIFKMFQRLHGKSEYSGSGVVLANVRKVVENHNGYIKAEGRPGKGATFKIWLPENNL